MLRSQTHLAVMGRSLLVLLLFWAGGCRRSSLVEEATREDRLLVGNGVEPSTLDPHLNTGSPESVIIAALWEPLVQWNEDATELIPAAAERWEASADGLTYTFHLRPTARWSNGEAVTAGQWVRSLQRLLDPALGAEFASAAFDLAGAEDFSAGRTNDPATVGLTAPDDHTLVMRLRAPNPAFLGFLITYPWLPVHVPSVDALGGLARRDSGFTRPGQLITNGAFRLAEWRPGQYVSVVPNPHFEPAPALREIRFYAIDSLDSEERSYRTGQLHVTSNVPAAKIPTYRAAGDRALRLTPRVGAHYLTLNVSRPPFDDARVRRAFALAIDRPQLAEAVLGAGEEPAHSLVYPMPAGYQPPARGLDDVATARQLLAEAGYPNGAGLPPIEYLYNTNERNHDVAQALQQMWVRHLGVRVVLRNEEWKVFLQSRRDGHYQIARAGWLTFTPEPIEMFQMAVSDSSLNDTRWVHPRYDQLYAAARQTLDPVQRQALYEELDVILRDEMPLVPLAYYARTRLVHPHVQRWTDNILDARSWAQVGVGAAP